MFCSLWEETPWGAVLQRIKVPFIPFELYRKIFRQVTWCDHCLRAWLGFALLLWLFKGTVCLWDEIEKQENRTLLEVVNFFRCVWARCSSLAKAAHHCRSGLLTHLIFWEFWRTLLLYFLFSPNSDWCWIVGRNMDVGLDVSSGKDNWVWFEILTRSKCVLRKMACVTVLVHRLSDK